MLDGRRKHGVAVFLYHFTSTEIYNAAREYNLDLVGRQTVTRLNHGVGGSQHDRIAACQRLPQVSHPQRVVDCEAVVISLTDKDEGENSVIDEILMMDAGEALRDDHPETKITWRGGGMFARGALPVVLAGDNRMAGRLADGPGVIDIRGVDAAKGKVCNLLKVRAVR